MWDVVLSQSVSGTWGAEDVDSVILHSVGSHLSSGTVSHPRRIFSSTAVRISDLATF